MASETNRNATAAHVQAGLNPRARTFGTCSAATVTSGFSRKSGAGSSAKADEA
jgi:hypothetical protein